MRMIELRRRNKSAHRGIGKADSGARLNGAEGNRGAGEERRRRRGKVRRNLNDGRRSQS